MPIIFLALPATLCGQFRDSDWSTNGGDAHRDSWIRNDAKITPASIAAPGFQLLWKKKFDNQTEKLNSLSLPVLMERYIGYRGFRSYAFIGGSGENAFTMDTDLGRVEWQKHFPAEPVARLNNLPRRHDGGCDPCDFGRVSDDDG